MRFRLLYKYGQIVLGDCAKRAEAEVISDDGGTCHATGFLYKDGWRIVIYGWCTTDLIDEIVALFEENTDYARTGVQHDA